MKTHMRMILSLCFALALLVGTGNVLASNPAMIGWWVLGSGGGPSAGGNVVLNATIGQPLVGISAGQNVSLSSGYWVGSTQSIVYLPLLIKADH